MGQSNEASFYDVEFVCSVARRIELSVDNRRNGGSSKKKRGISQTTIVEASAELKKSKYAPVEVVKQSGAGVGGRSAEKTGRFGKTFQQHLDENTCARCNQDRPKGVYHRCHTAIRSHEGGNKVLRVMTKTGTKPKPKINIGEAIKTALLVAEADKAVEKAKSVSPETGGEDIVMSDETDLNLRAEATLIDDMSNVSVADKADLLQNMAAQEYSFVQLAHQITTVPRIGTVSLNLEYNKFNKHHLFEVFSFYSEENVHVLLGMDILSKLGIGITGLVSQHGFQAGSKLPDPIDDSIKPNEHPFGTEEERKPFVLKLNELLKWNSQIDMKNTQCNLPDSVIRLDTTPGAIAYRAQYPLPEAYRDVVAKQIQVWLDEGVITRSTSHTRFSHPLLVVKKKDADGNYSMSKPRVVCDVRKLNAILEVDDKQQLPLISTIHQNIGTKTIHSCLDIHACFTSFALERSQAHKVSFTCPFSNI
ncbi:hypothetical protein BD408DRAFT_67542, partial [Parasitella parasitica]